MRELGVDGVADRIDQVAFSYFMNTYHSHLKILPVSEQIVRSCYMQWYFHKSDDLNMVFYYDILDKDVRYMFNRRVECMYLIPQEQQELLNRIKFLEGEYMYELKKNMNCNQQLNHQSSQIQNLHQSVESLKTELANRQAEYSRHNSNMLSTITQQKDDIFRQGKMLEQQNEEIKKYESYFDNIVIKLLYKLIRAYRKHIKKYDVY